MDYNYLNSLIFKVNELRKQIGFYEIDIASCSISYMPTKKTSFIGFKEGYGDVFTRNQKSMRQSDKLRSTTKGYLRFIKNINGELVQVESYNHGRIDCLFQVHWFEHIRYLFPFSTDGTYYPTYTYVTKYDSNHVVEEYMVDGSQIVYETYSYKPNHNIDYTLINYVTGGNYPVREVRKGVFQLNPLTYEEKYYDSWLFHRID